jgi:hypothetical protein
MQLFQLEEQQVNVHRERAKGILAFGNQVSTEIKRLYEMGRDMFWQVPDWKIEDAQKLIDELDNLVPNGAVKVFQHSGALGEFLLRSGLITQEQVGSPVEYKIENGKIILTGSRYPSELSPEENVTLQEGTLQ